MDLTVKLILGLLSTTELKNPLHYLDSLLDQGNVTRLIILLKSRSEIIPVKVHLSQPIEIHPKIVNPNLLQARRELVVKRGSDWQAEEELEASV